MLGKLFKNEMKACARLLLPIYLVLTVCTILNRVFLNLDIFKGVTKIIPGMIGLAYVLSIIAIIVVSFVIIILRFYKNLITDEGYLMFTLPVKTNQLINSKLIAAIIWTLLSVIAVAGSIFAVVITPERFERFKNGLAGGFDALYREFGSLATLFIIEIILLILISTIQSILHIYASVAIGQLVNGHKVLGSFGAYVVIYIICQVIGVVVLVLADIIIKHPVSDMDMVVKVIFPLYLLYTLVFGIAFYVVTDILFKKKLNLE